MKDKNKYGQYFTVDPVAGYMVSLITHNTRSKVLEPSCGEGVFLRNLEKAGFSCIDAYEIDKSLNNPYPFVRYESFVSSALDKYDVIIGNPPYIRWKNLEQELKDELALSPLWKKYFNSLCDYLFIFILKSIEQLNEGGELIFICTDYWMNTTNAASLREYMVANGYFSDIFHFKEASLFEGVCASFVVFRYVKSLNKEKSINLYLYNQTGAPSLEQMKSLSCFDKSDIPQFKRGERWLLATAEQQELLRVFEDNCRKGQEVLFADDRDIFRIGDFCEIGNGMVSGYDKAFNVTGLDDLTEREERAVIKVLKAKDLDQYLPRSDSRYFFIRERIAEEELINQYPHIFAHMKPYIEGLDSRYSYGKEIPYWEFVFPRNLNLFLRPEKRIFVPCKERISNKDHFRFVLAESSYFPLQDVTGILKKANCKESIEYITAYLNNYRVFEWLRFNGVVKGHIVEFSETPIASIPYRPIDWGDPAEIAIHNSITECVICYQQTRDNAWLVKIERLFDYLYE